MNDPLFLLQRIQHPDTVSMDVVPVFFGNLEQMDTYVMRCVIWYQSLFGIFMIVRTHTNACQRFFYLSLVSISLCE